MSRKTVAAYLMLYLFDTEFDPNILQLSTLPGRILFSPMTQLFKSK